MENNSTLRKVQRPGAMSKSVQSLDRALAVVEALASSRDGLGISELSRKLHLPPSTVHRLLAALDRNGYATRVDGRYYLGQKVVELGRIFLQKYQLREIVRPYLEDVSQKTGETANLVVLDSNEAFYLDKVDSPRILRVFSKIGHRAPLYCTGCGKLLLSDFTPEQLDRYLRKVQLKPLTANTITSATALKKELGRIRRRGFAFDLEECEVGARCAAVPIRGFGGRPIGALSISGPSVRLSDLELTEAVKLLKATAAEIAKQEIIADKPAKK